MTAFPTTQAPPAPKPPPPPSPEDIKAKAEAAAAVAKANKAKIEAGGAAQRVSQDQQKHQQELSKPAPVAAGGKPPPAASGGAAPAPAPAPKIAGLVVPGNIDLNTRPVVNSSDGSYSTVRSITITDDKGQAILIPTVIPGPDGKPYVAKDADAVAYYKRTGQHLGVFANEPAANAYAQTLHENQAAQYGPKTGVAKPPAATSTQGLAAAEAPKPQPLLPALPPEGDPVDASGKPVAVPQKQQVNFTPAQYEGPKKGLEYAAAALSLLFPGAPIGRMASQFAVGLKQNADQKYARNEQQAEQKYKVDENNAQTGFENQSATYNAAVAKVHDAFIHAQAQAGIDAKNAEINFRNADARRQFAIDQAKKGLTQSGEPIPYPSVQSLLPKNKKPTSQDYANAYSQLVRIAGRNGDDANGALFGNQFTTYTGRVNSEIEQTNAVNRLHMQFSHEDAIHADTENRADARAAATRAHEDLVALRSNGAEFQRTREQLSVGMGRLTTELGNLRKPDPLTGATPMDDTTYQNLSKAMRAVAGARDPASAAAAAAQHFTNPQAGTLLQEYGGLQEMDHRVRGIPVIPTSYDEPPKRSGDSGGDGAPPAPPQRKTGAQERASRISAAQPHGAALPAPVAHNRQGQVFSNPAERSSGATAIVKNGLDHGVPEAGIRAALKDKHYTPKEIDDAILMGNQL